MLLTERDVGDRIYVGENIVVEVLEIQGNRVKLGIVAPEDMKILRKELIDLESKPCGAVTPT